MLSVEQIKEVLKNVIDPELGYNLVDLGLIYDIVPGDRSVDIKMTLTTPACPLGPALVTAVRQTLLDYFPDDLDEVNVDLVWLPIWSPDMMSEELKEELGYG